MFIVMQSSNPSCHLILMLSASVTELFVAIFLVNHDEEFCPSTLVLLPLYIFRSYILLRFTHFAVNQVAPVNLDIELLLNMINSVIGFFYNNYNYLDLHCCLCKMGSVGLSHLLSLERFWLLIVLLSFRTFMLQLLQQ